MTQIHHAYDYATTYQQALRVNWTIDDIIGGDKALDFTQPFLPDAWVDAGRLDFMSEAEQMTLNHIRSHSYLSLFGLVEEYIVPFLVNHIQSRVHQANQEEMKALFQFAEEESKHIELFQCFSEDFRSGFGTPCGVIGPPQAVASAILAKPPLGVALSILHIEWMTQLHYIESVKDNTDLDAQFRSLLRHHWMEEAQHAKMDTMITALMVESMAPAEIQQGIEDYLGIGGMFDDAFAQQVELDLTAFTRAAGRPLTCLNAEAYRSIQRQSYRKTFLTSGMRHSKFQHALMDISPEGAQQVLDVAHGLVPEPA